MAYKERKVNYANGMFISNARKIAQFVFGDFLRRVYEDGPNNCFVFELRDVVEDENGKILELNEEVDVSYFKKFWGKGFPLKIVKEEELEDN